MQEIRGWKGGGGEGLPVARQKTCACQNKSPRSVRRKFPGTKRRGRLNQPSVQMGGRANNRGNGRYRHATQHNTWKRRKKKTGGLFTVSTSCLSLKYDQKHPHAHLIISVKYSFNKVCVVKTMWFYRLLKNQRRAQIDPLFHNASANTRHAGATMETQTHKTPETGETSVVIQHRRWPGRLKKDMDHMNLSDAETILTNRWQEMDDKRAKVKKKKKQLTNLDWEWEAYGA